MRRELVTIGDLRSRRVLRAPGAVRQQRLAALSARVRRASMAIRDQKDRGQWPISQASLIEFQDAYNAAVGPGSLVVTGQLDSPTIIALKAFASGALKPIGIGHPLLSMGDLRHPLRGLGDAATDAAIAMNNALNAHGYRATDQPLYGAFQTAAGIRPADRYPGAGTMAVLDQVLTAAGVPVTTVPRYAWKAAPGYDGVNAPTAAEWYAGGAAPSSTKKPTTPSAEEWAWPVVGIALAGGVAFAIGRMMGKKKRSTFVGHGHKLLPA